MIIAALFLAREDRNMSRLKRLADPRGDRLIKLVNAVRRSRLLAEVEEDAVFVSMAAPQAGLDDVEFLPDYWED